MELATPVRVDADMSYQFTLSSLPCSFITGGVVAAPKLKTSWAFDAEPAKRDEVVALRVVREIDRSKRRAILSAGVEGQRFLTTE